MDTWIEVLEKPKLKNPIFIEGLPGIGNVGRIVAGSLIEELKAKKFAHLYSPYFSPFVLLQNDVVHVLRNEFFYWQDPKGKNDLIILVGDCQSSEQGGFGHYEVAAKILDFVEGYGTKFIYTLGGFGTGEIEKDEPEVLGAVSDEKLMKEFGKYKINFEETSEKVGMIIGATGLILGLGKLRGMDGVCLMGETTGFPILTDPKAAKSVIKVLIEAIGLDINLASLDGRVKEMKSFLKRLEDIQMRAMKHQKETVKKDELRYIG